MFLLVFPLIVRYFQEERVAEAFLLCHLETRCFLPVTSLSWFPPTPPLSLLSSTCLSPRLSSSHTALYSDDFSQDSGFAHLSTFTEHHTHPCLSFSLTGIILGLWCQQSSYTCWHLHGWKVSEHSERFITTRGLLKIDTLRMMGAKFLTMKEIQRGNKMNSVILGWNWRLSVCSHSF